LTEVVLEGVEQLEQLVADPLAIAAAADASGDEHAGLLEAVQRSARCCQRHAVPSGGGVCTHDRLSRQPEDDLAGDGRKRRRSGAQPRSER